MLNADDIQRGLTGAWRLFLGKREAIRLFDTSFRGFWRSFLAAILVLPIYVLYVGAERRMIFSALPDGADFPELGFALARLLSLVIDWAAFPLVTAIIAAPMGFASNYVRLIVAFNWGSPIISAMVALPAILFGFGLAPEGVAQLLLFTALILAIRFRFITARAALECSFALAAGIVALEFLLSLVLSELISRATGM
ncbi:hypothetical protein [Microbaculum marinisediminis]|uniref:Permease n=1 Tax=Microbaculum marinisediminis TaxID=2931392 RepID=A0AAW5QUY7_9HYPH|nr:hypothetical protein [Microbaculum sp. A6E488]MCT8970825.1 hypothetical protein [Microbaculum sp. A6E488]